MVATRIPDYLSEEEYLALEEASDVKHEYIDGEIYAMAGATDAHVTIAGNCAVILRNHGRGSSYRAYMAAMRLQIPRQRTFFYPDVMVTCDGRDRDQINHKSHPCLIIEVLSDSTEAFDRGDKFTVYQSIETLQEYVLINAKYPRVECFRRNEEGLWVLQSYELGTSLELASVDLSISLDDIYEDVEANRLNRQSTRLLPKLLIQKRHQIGHRIEIRHQPIIRIHLHPQLPRKILIKRHLPIKPADQRQLQIFIQPIARHHLLHLQPRMPRHRSVDKLRHLPRHTLRLPKPPIPLGP